MSLPRLTSVLISAFACGVSFSAWAEGLAATWSYPAWATPSQPFEGTVHVDVPQDAEVRVAYTIPDGPARRVPCSPEVSGTGSYTFSLPADSVSGANEIQFWLEVTNTAGETHSSNKRSVPRSQAREVEVSGKTDEELFYPLDDWRAEILFRPCCLIISGWIHLERIPVLPTSSAEGLPAVLLSRYFRIDPDDLVEATGGVNVRITFEVTSDTGVALSSVQPYQWQGNRWSPVFDATLDSEAKRVTFPFPRGGLVVIAGNPSK